MAKKNSSAPSRRNSTDLDESDAASRRNMTDLDESDAASTPESSPSPSKSDSPPPESSSQSPPPSASPPPPRTSPPPEPSPSPPPPKLSPPPPSPPPPSSNNNSSSPTGHSPPPPSSSTLSPPPPSSSTPPPSPPPPSSSTASPPPPSSSTRSPPPPSSSSPPSPSSSSPPPPPPSPSSPSPPRQSVPAPSSNSSPPSPPPVPVSSQNATSQPTRQSSRPPPTGFVPPSGSGSNSQSPPSSRGLSHSSHSKSSGSSVSSSRGDSENIGKYIGFALAGVFFVALVAVVIVFVLMRKRKGTQYNAPYVSHNDFPMKPDGHPYQQHGTVNVPQEGFYGSQPPHSSLGSNFKNASQIGTMHHSGTTDVGVIVSQIVFSFENILEITNGLSRENVIGEGGFGCVYKAWLPDGRIVAVKQLKAGSGQGEREFKAEVEIISRVHHRHLVSLVGYCICEQQRILVYEFVPNKTLDQHLHGSGMQVLDWAKRVKIAIGAAKGLAYLHEDCNPKIIHRDIKSANILLDDSFEARVADFGLAKLNNDANTHVSTRVMGTFGYLAPEYATSGKLTDRSDVFSFGVVLLELITGRKPVDQTQPIGDESLVEWARPLLIHAVETGDCSQLIDPKLERNFVESEMRRMVEAAAACIRHSAPKRPRMIQVVRALDSRDELSDLSNGVKYGQSIVYDSGQYNEDIMRFRMNNSFGSSEFDMYSGEYNSKEYSGIQNSCALANSSGESETRAFNKHSFRTQHLKVGQLT